MILGSNIIYTSNQNMFAIQVRIYHMVIFMTFAKKYWWNVLCHSNSIKQWLRYPGYIINRWFGYINHFITLTINRYVRGTISGSINIPHSTAFTPDGALVASDTLKPFRNQIKVIVGGAGKGAIRVRWLHKHV